MGAQFAPVAPIQLLEEMKKRNILGRYHLFLTHHTLEFPDRFKELCGGTNWNAGNQLTIIMDNSVVELGDAVSDEKVFEACEVVKGQNWVYPVLIDVMADGPATQEASAKSWDWWREKHPEYSPMAVLQGSDWKSFTETADYFLCNPHFEGLENVGIPRVLVDHLGTRQLAIQYVDALRPDVNVHLLGFSNDVTDDIICSNMAAVRGIDSAVPIRYGHSVPGGIYTPSADIPPRPKDWFEVAEWDPTIEKNLHNIRKWCA